MEDEEKARWESDPEVVEKSEIEMNAETEEEHKITDEAENEAEKSDKEGKLGNFHYM